MKNFLLLAVLVFGAASCGDFHSSFSSSSSESGIQGSFLGDPRILQRIESAPYSQSYHGEREIHFYAYGEGGHVDSLSYREGVVSDGEGGFAVVSLEVMEPDMSPDRRELFRLVQRSREEFFFNHRDFQIRNMDLFQANYNVAVIESEYELLERRAMRLLVRSIEKDTGHYEVEVDLDSGLTLGHKEFDVAGRLVSELAFTELFVGRLSPTYREQVRSHQPNWREAVPQETFGDGVVEAPRVPPAGYQLLEERIVSDPMGHEWHELIYADGVEQLFILFAKEEANNLRVTTPNEVMAYGHGAWNIIEGMVQRQRVIVLGKISQDELLLTLESCL